MSTSKITQDFTAAQLKEWGLPSEPPEGGAIMSDKITGHRRWSVDHELIFTLPGMSANEAWKVTYSRGATESQDERPWEYETTVTATLVRQVDRVVTVWIDAEAPADPGGPTEAEMRFANPRSTGAPRMPG